MEGAISTTPKKKIQRPCMTRRRGTLYFYPEDPPSPTLYVLERKKNRALGIPPRPERRPNNVWGPGGQTIFFFNAALV